MEASTSTASYFNVFITGQIESAIFPLGPDASEIFCRYEVVAGQDWERVSGLSRGITQAASNYNGRFNDEIIFNMPIEMTFKSTNPFGWPQIIISVYGKTFWNTETVLGYCRVHVPLFGAKDSQKINAPILMPQCSNWISDIARYLSGKNPELKNPHILMDNTITKGLAAESYGEINLTLHVITRGVNRLGYACSS